MFTPLPIVTHLPPSRPILPCTHRRTLLAAPLLLLTPRRSLAQVAPPAPPDTAPG